MKRKEFMVEGVAEPLSHYTHAVQHGSLLFISGCVPVDRDGNVVGEDASTQTRQVLKNMENVLGAAEASWGNILKVTVYLTRIDDRASINPARKEFFGESRPASTLVEVSSLALPDARVEIDAVVGLDE